MNINQSVKAIGYLIPRDYRESCMGDLYERTYRQRARKSPKHIRLIRFVYDAFLFAVAGLKMRADDCLEYIKNYLFTATGLKVRPYKNLIGPSFLANSKFVGLVTVAIIFLALRPLWMGLPLLFLCIPTRRLRTLHSKARSRS